VNISNIIPLKKELSLKSIVTFEKTPLNLFLLFGVVIALGLFAAGAVLYFLHGHHAYNVTREHPWGLLIAMYVFFVVSSTGLCIISSFGHVFGIKEFEVISKRAIIGAIITLVSGFAVILLEIGHPIRMVIYNILTPGYTSAIWWMGTLYATYLVFIIFEFTFLMRSNHHIARYFAIGGLIVGISAHSNLGAIFGFLVARPIANGVFYPIYFILSAMITGSYLIFIAYGYKYKLDFPEEIKKMLLKLAYVLGILLAILIFFEIWRMMTSIYGGMPGRADAARHILTTANFWVGEILLGALIPFLVILFTKGKALSLIVYSSLSGMIGIFFMRYDLVHDSQLMPLQTMKLREYQEVPTFIHYMPSFSEIAISIGGVGICLLLYYLADKVFDLD
jgi:molybdopterin-containing oxidoreductase family membrane subunit